MNPLPQAGAISNQPAIVKKTSSEGSRKKNQGHKPEAKKPRGKRKLRAGWITWDTDLLKWLREGVSSSSSVSSSGVNEGRAG
jgi:hypothetical protein